MTLNSRHLKVLLPAIAGVAISLFIFVQVKAQSGPIDSYTYFVPYPYQALANQFDVSQSTYPDLTNANINTVISITADRDNTTIYYDHHEDGLVPDITSPAPGSVEVYTLMAGDVLILNDVVPGNCTTSPTGYCYDGGDALHAVGGTISVALTVFPMLDPNDPGSRPGVWFAGAWGLLPTIQWGNEYIIPVGQDVPRAGNGFGVVGLNVQSVQANTVVTIDLNDGVTPPTTVTLGYGEQYTVIQGVMAGASVQASAPVQVHLFTGDPLETGELYEARAYTMLPRENWFSDYLAPRSSDGDYWIYNPDITPLDVRVETTGGVSIVTVPAEGVARYSTTAGMSGPTGARLTSVDGRVFDAVVALDDSYSQDWGYAVLPVERLTSQALVGFGVGDASNYPNDPSSGDPQNRASRVYVTALTTTTVAVDYDNDNNPDATYTISPLEELSIIDPNDFNLTGAVIYSLDGTPIVTVWGQDESAIVAGTSLDVGTSIAPLPSVDAEKTYTFIRDADCTGTITLGDTVEFRIDYFNRSFVNLADAVISDTLDSSLDYVPNSTVLNGSTPVPDGAGTPADPIFPLAPNGYQVVGGGNPPVAPWDFGYVTFNTIISTTGTATNIASVRSSDLHLGQQHAIASVDIATGSTTPAMEINTRLIDPPAGTTIVGGNVITFGITITNTSGVTLTTVPIEFAFDGTVLSYLNAATVLPDVTATNAITWSDLTISLGDLLPNGTIDLTVTMRVNQITPDVTGTEVRTRIVEADRADALPPLICQGDDAITLSYVDPIITKNGTPDQAVPGDMVYFNITVFNPAPPSNASATGVMLIEPIPTELDLITYTYSSNPPGLVDNAIHTANVITLDIGDLGMNESVTLYVTTTANSLANPSDTIVNTARLEYNEGNPKEDSASLNVPPPNPGPDPNPTPNPGDKDKGTSSSSSSSSAAAEPPPAQPAPAALPVLFLPETGIDHAETSDWIALPLLGIMMAFYLWRVTKKN